MNNFNLTGSSKKKTSLCRWWNPIQSKKIQDGIRKRIQDGGVRRTKTPAVACMAVERSALSPAITEGESCVESSLPVSCVDLSLHPDKTSSTCSPASSGVTSRRPCDGDEDTQRGELQRS